MKKGVELIELELGKKSDKHKLKYNKMCEEVIKKLKGSSEEFELIDRFNCSIKNYKLKKNENGLFHAAIDTGDFDNYNLYFLMKDCFQEFQIDVNLFTIRGKYFVKTENFYTSGDSIDSIDDFFFNKDVFVINEGLVLTKEYERLMNFYKKIDPEKAKEYRRRIELIVNNYHELMEALKTNYFKLDVELFDRIRKGYDDYELSYMRGEILLRERKYYQAEKEFKKVLLVDKKFKNVQFDIGYSLYKQGRYEESLDYLNKSIEKNYEVLLHMGLCHFKKRNFPKAIGFLNETLMINEKCEKAYSYLALCNMKRSNFETAREVIYSGIKNVGINRNFRRILKQINYFESKITRPIIHINLKKGEYTVLKEVKA